MFQLHKKSFKIVDFSVVLKSTIFLVILLIIYIFKFTTIVGVSMEPTFYNGQKGISIMDRFGLLSFKRSDIVLIEKRSYNPNKVLIKRVIGCPGDNVCVIDNSIYINGELIVEDYIKEVMSSPNMSVELGENEYFVLGDNRNNSIDSRLPNIGIIKDNEIIGKLLFTIN